MNRSAGTVPHRVLLWGVLAPLLVGAAVPAVAAVALLWLLAGLGTIVVSLVVSAIGAADPGEDGDPAPVDDDEPVAVVREPAVIGRWWVRYDDDPNVAAARAGSWG